MGEPDERATILVVDDERGPRESLRMILAPSHEVLLARSGSEALEILRSRPVDLVTLDLRMPGIGGEELMRTLRGEFPRVEIVIITGCGTVESAAEGIRYGICDYLLKPFDVVQVTGSVVRALARQRARRRLVHFLDELGQVVGRGRQAGAIVADVQRSHSLRGRLADLFDASLGGPDGPPPLDPTRTVEFLEVLGETIESKDYFLRGHARRVAFYASLMAHRLGLTAEQHEHVRIAAFLHDVGKVGVAPELLLRRGALDAAERGEVEQHPAVGARLLGPLDLPDAVASAIRHHHEWWDGTGYPDGLAGEEIPLTARIISLADAFDAMTCERPYRPALAREVVVGELRRFAGVQFDPDLAKEFLAILETGVCDVEPEIVAEVVADAAGPPVPLAH